MSVFADFDNPNKILTANSYVDVLVLKKINDIFLVKQNYAFFDENGAFVYVVKNNKPKKVHLDIAAYYEDSYVVKNDFAKGEFLVIDKIGNIPTNTKIETNLVKQPAEKS